MKKLLRVITGTALVMFLGMTWLAGSSLGAAESSGTITVGGQEIVYDQVFEDDTDQDQVKDRKSYYSQGSLVLTTWDTNQDGREDLWFTYDEGEYLKVEAADMDFDGEPDELTYLDRNETVTRVERTGQGLWGKLWPAAAGAAVIALAAVLLLRKRRQPEIDL